MWYDTHPLMQFKDLLPHLSSHRSVEVMNIPMHEMKEMSERELEALFRSKHVGDKVRHFCQAFPLLDIDFIVKPITEGVIRVRLLITPKFKWDNGIHGGVQHFYAWIEDPQHDSIYHMESFIVTKKMGLSGDPIELIFTVPLAKPMSMEYFIRVVSSQFMSKWMNFFSCLFCCHLHFYVLMRTFLLSIELLSDFKIFHAVCCIWSKHLYSFTIYIYWMRSESLSFLLQIFIKIKWNKYNEKKW